MRCISPDGNPKTTAVIKDTPFAVKVQLSLKNKQLSVTPVSFSVKMKSSENAIFLQRLFFFSNRGEGNTNTLERIASLQQSAEALGFTCVLDPPPPSQHVGLRLLNQGGRQFVRSRHCLMVLIPIWMDIAADYITWEARRWKMGGGDGGRRSQEEGGRWGSPRFPSGREQ